MKKVAIVMLTIFSISIASPSFARNYPCSGKKGGVSHCTADGKFMCNDGTISRSKKVCSR